jgi:tetratricopeptide (TPR) repeat protein
LVATSPAARALFDGSTTGKPAGTRPRDYYVLFILVYASQEELSTRTIQRGSELDRLMTALEVMGVPLNRRRFLLTSAALAAGVAGAPAAAADLEGPERLAWMLKHPRSVDLPTVMHLRQRAEHLLGQYETVPSTSLLPAAWQQLERATLLREQAPFGRVRGALAVVEAQSATLTGRLVWAASGQRDHATAARYYDQGINAAANANEGWVKAFPRMFQRFLPAYGGSADPKKGLELAEAAVARAGDGSSQVIAGWSWALAGEAHALLGEKRGAKLALDRAWSHLANVTTDDPALGLFTKEQLGGFVGVCCLLLGDPKGAQAALQEAAERLGANRDKHKAVMLGDLAKAHARQGDLEQACCVLHQAIDLVELTRDAGGMKRAFAAGRQLRRWQHEPPVQDVQDRLLTLGC